MNKKGFTLIELLGVIIILSIIMLIAIPNVTSILERSKKDTYLADARKMVSLTEYEIRKGNVLKPNAGEMRKVTLEDLATGDVVTDPDDKEYDITNSYVLVTRKDGYLVYFVQLVTNNNGSYRGIRLTNRENLDGDKKYEAYGRGIDLPSTDQQSTIVLSNN